MPIDFLFYIRYIVVVVFFCFARHSFCVRLDRFNFIVKRDTCPWQQQHPYYWSPYTQLTTCKTTCLFRTFNCRFRYTILFSLLNQIKTMIEMNSKNNGNNTFLKNYFYIRWCNAFGVLFSISLLSFFLFSLLSLLGVLCIASERKSDTLHTDINAWCRYVT